MLSWVEHENKNITSGQSHPTVLFLYAVLVKHVIYARLFSDILVYIFFEKIHFILQLQPVLFPTKQNAHSALKSFRKSFCCME